MIRKTIGLLWTGLVLCAAADRIQFANGRGIDVLVQEETPTSVTFRQGTGLITLPNKNITITYGTPQENQALEHEWMMEHFYQPQYAPEELKGLLADYRELLKKRRQMLADQKALRALEDERESAVERAETLQDGLVGQRDSLRKKEAALTRLRTLHNRKVNEMNALVAQMNNTNDRNVWNALQQQYSSLKQEEIALSQVTDRAQTEYRTELKKVNDNIRALQNADRLNRKVRTDMPRFHGQISPYMNQIKAFETQLKTYESAALHQKYADIFAAIDETLQKMHSELRTDEITLERDGHTLLVDVMLNDSVPARMIFDTGAGATTISRALAERLGLDVNKESSSFAILADGSTVSTVPFVLDSVRLGDAVREDVDVSMIDQSPGEGIDGLLGMSFLKFFTVQFSGDQDSVQLTHLEAK